MARPSVKSSNAEHFKEKVVKATLKKPTRDSYTKEQLEPGDNSRNMQMALRIFNMPEIDTNNATEVQGRIAEYFTLCNETDHKANMAELALALGADRATVFNWLTGKVKSKPKDVIETIKKAHALINAQYEDMMNNGKINPVAGIFLMKNNMGYTDKTEIEIAPTEDKQNDIASLTSAADLLDDTITGQIADNSTE